MERNKDGEIDHLHKPIPVFLRLLTLIIDFQT